MKKIMIFLMILALAGCAPQVAEEAEPAAEPMAKEPAVSEPIVEAVPEPVVEAAQKPIAEKKETAPAPSTAVDPILLKEGNFKEVVHRTSGLVKIYKQPDGKQLLTMTGFDTTPGPGLSIVLHKGIPAAGFEAGRLISASGNYPYDLPADLDVSPYTHVAVYNKKYNVVYGEAELR